MVRMWQHIQSKRVSRVDIERMKLASDREKAALLPDPARIKGLRVYRSVGCNKDRTWK